MRKLFNWAAARLVAAFALALPLAAMAATPVAVWDGDFNDLTKFTGYELVDWNETHGENKSSCTIDRANHGLMFNAENAMPGMTILVRYSNLTAGSSKKVLFTSCVASNHSGYRTGVRLGTDGKICGMWGNADNGTASGSVPESGVMAFTYSTAGTYLYAAEKGTEALKQVWGSSSLKSSDDTAIYGGSAGGFCDGSSISGFSAAAGMTIEAIAVFNSVVSLAEMQEYLWPTEAAVVVSRTIAADATVNWVDAAWAVGETADQTFTPSADALYNVTVTVGGDCTIVMPETIGTFNRRRIKFVLDDGVGSATVALKYPGTLPETGSSVELNPFGDALVVAGSGVTLSPAYNGDTAGYMVSVSDLTVTIIKGSNYEGTLTANTNWSDIKPEGWANAIAGDQPSIIVNYEGTEPVTLTFDEAVQAGSLTLNGNIVVEATAAATFGTVTAGAGSVVEMANVTIATQTGAGVYRYRSNYPVGIAQNKVYEFVGGTSESPVEISDPFDVYGYLKLSGYFNFADYAMSTVGTLDVLSGKVTVNCSGAYLAGDITIRNGAEFVNVKASDALNYNSSATVNVYGTLTMGTTRWTVGNNNVIILHGGTVTGAGEGTNGALDFIGTGSLSADADSTISANVKFRNSLTSVTVDENVTLTISGITRQGYNGGGITKKGAGTLKFTSDPYVPGGITVEAGTLAFDTQSDVDPVVTYTAAVLNSANMDYAVSNNWKGTVVVSALEAGATTTQVALNKTGNANSYLTLNGISGDAWCAGSDYTVQPAITLAGNVNFENGTSKKTVTFRKIAAGTGNLSLKSWSTCTGITYGFTTLDADNYTGTIQLDGSVLTFNVGDILKAGAAVGDKVLPLTVANNATVNLANATLNGEAAGFELREDGVYYTTAYVTINVPAVANTTVNVVSSSGGVVDNGDGTYKVANGATVTVTYSSDDYEVTGGTFEFTASDGYTVDTTGVTTAPYVAQIKVGTEYEKYTSVALALTSENVYRGITLLGNATEGTLNITQQYVMLTGAGYTLTADITVGASTTFVPYNVTIGGDLTVNGVYNQMGTVAVTGDLTTGDGARLQFSTLGTDVAALTVGGDIAVNGALTLTPNSTSGLTTGVAYKALNGATVTLAEGASVTLGTIEGAILGYVVEPNETTTLTIKIPAAKVGEDDYHDTFASARAAAAGVGVITLLKDVSSVVTNYNTQTGYITSIVTNDLVTIAADEVLKINANGYVICVGLASGLTPPVYTLSTVTDGNVATYSVVHSVASVDNELYPSLAAAVAAAEDGQTVMLLDNIALGSTIVITNSITLDLNGHDIAATGVRALWIKSGSVSITGEGVVSANGNGLGETSSVIRVGDGATNANAAGLTIGANVAVESAKCYGVTAFGKNTPGITLVVNGTVAVTSSGEADAAISGNGSPGLAETYITINSGATVTSANSAAIYNPGAGTLTVNGGTITGKHGIVARAGSVAVNGGTITATGTAQDAETIGDSANVIPCAAIAYDAGANYPGFDDGTAIAVTGGTFTSNVDSIDTTGEPTVAVSGGEFSSAVPAEYCAEGYEPTDDGEGHYTVRVDLGWIYEAEDHPNYTGGWSNSVAYAEDHKIKIEDGNTYTANRPSDGRFVTVAMTLSFDDVNDDASDFGDAKTAIRLASGETDGTYQFQLYTSDGANKVWTNATVVGVTATKEVDYNFVFVLDLTNKTYTASVVSGATTNALTIGESVTAIPFAYQGDVTPVQTIDFVGSGTVSSIEGSYEDAPAPEGFVEDQVIGDVTLTSAQAAWLNGQSNYDELAAKIAEMEPTAFNDAYLLNLDITGGFSYEFKVESIEVGDDDVTLTVSLTRTGALDETTEINGTVALTGTDELGKEFTTISEATVVDEDFSEGNTTTITLDKGDAKFFQPVIKERP